MPERIDLAELSRLHHPTRVGSCWQDRQVWPCRRWVDAETINDLLDALAAERSARAALADANAELRGLIRVQEFDDGTYAVTIPTEHWPSVRAILAREGGSAEAQGQAGELT